MDGPFGALDVQTRQFMQESLLRILERENKTVIFIMHGVEEAVSSLIELSSWAQAQAVSGTLFPSRFPNPRSIAMSTSAEFIRSRAGVEEVVREEFMKATSRASASRSRLPS